MPCVVLPAYNECEALPWVLSRIPQGYDPIVVDNGSTDGTAHTAASLGARVVSEPRLGFGAACHAGLLATNDDIVCFMDCDASLDPGDLPRVVEPLVTSDADLVLGARRPRPGAWPLHARAANRVLALEVRRRSGVSLRELGPMRACRRIALIGLNVHDRRFGWPLEMVLRAADQAWDIREVPVDYLPRVGRSKVTGTLLGTARTVGDMYGVLR